MQVHETQSMKKMFSRKLFQFSSYVQIYTYCVQRLRLKMFSENEQKLSNKTLLEECRNTEFFVILVFLYSVRIQDNTDHKNLFTQ